MSRTVLAASLVIALFGALALSFIWYLSFGIGESDPDDAALALLQRPVELSYYEDGTVSINAESELDAYRALGFHTGRRYPWTISVLRQTAIGGLSEWFGPSVTHIDEFALRLGLGAGAREAAGNLEPLDAEVLAAFAEGVSRALTLNAVGLTDEFVLFDIKPLPWEPWHTLAIERLVSWLSSPPLGALVDDTLFASAKTFDLADRDFRAWTRLHGFDMSTALTWEDSTDLSFEARFVYGATTHSLFAPVRIGWPGVSFSGICTVGTPFFPVINGNSGLRITLLSSERAFELVRLSPDDPGLVKRYDRISDKSGNESLVSTTAFEDAILLDDERRLRDSVLVTVALRWAGLGPGTDWPGWRRRALAAGSTEGNRRALRRFTLIDGHGSLVEAGRARILGSPTVGRADRNQTFVGLNSTLRFAGTMFMESGPAALKDDLDDVSLWAEQNVPVVLGLATVDSSLDSQTAEAVDYLRNWDYRYERSSIGASIFDGWMRQFRPQPGTYPSIAVPSDSIGLVQFGSELRRSLEAAVDSMSRVAGNDLARWRLEYFRPGRRFYPVWNYGPLQDDLPAMGRSRYAPIEIPQDGHPTTLRWQNGPLDDPANSPSHVLVSGTVGDVGSTTIRPDYAIGSGFIARYVAGAPSDPSTRSRTPVSTIRLVPDGRLDPTSRTRD